MITTAVANSFKSEILQGIHQPTDDYKLALYSSTATLGEGTAAYSASNEVSGDGYTAGGQSLAGFSVALSGSAAQLTFDDVVWDPATITARGGLIYNATRGNKAVASFDFGADITSTNGPFTASVPADAVEVA
jgi:hypothetical protein